ncbi:hypothetical protein GCM10018963_15690 [Saccharothrix longispora]
MNTLECFEEPGYLMTGALLVSGTAHVAGERSARDRHTHTWGARVQLVQVPAPYAPTVVPTQIVAPSAQGRST